MLKRLVGLFFFSERRKSILNYENLNKNYAVLNVGYVCCKMVFVKCVIKKTEQLVVFVVQVV